MVSNVSTCHAPSPEPPLPAALAERGVPSPAAPAADALVASHAYGVAVALGPAATPKPAASAGKPSAAVAGYATATATGTTATKTTTSRTTTAKTTTTAAKPTLPSALSFLNDKNLSVEEKLLRLLAYLNDRWDKDIENKMREIENVTGASASSPSASSSSGASGFLGSVAKVAKTVAGPALAATATAFGVPALAPAALQLGPSLVDSGLGLLSSATGTPVPVPTSSSSGEVSSDRKAQVKIMEIERISQQQKEWFSAVSNLLSTRHELRMGVLQNWK